MEGAPHVSIENIEKGQDWQRLKDLAPLEANFLIEKIDGFPNMDTGEQIRALSELFSQLADTHNPAFNKNRFIANQIALKQEDLEKRLDDIAA